MKTPPPQTSSIQDPTIASRAEGRRHWDRVAEGWTTTGRDALWRQHSDAVNRALVEAWAPPGGFGTLLKTDTFDEAASTGLDDLLSARASRVVYTDLSFKILRSARSTHQSLMTVCCDVRQLPFASGSIDAVVSNSTLDHFPTTGEITTSFRELSRVLCHDGRLLLTLDNPANPVIGLRQILPQKLLRKTGLVPYYVGATLGPFRLKRCLTENGFRIRRLSATLHCPRVLAVLVSRFLQRHGSPHAQRRFLAGLLGFERFEHWPTKYLSGYFLTVSAIKSPHACPASHARASDTEHSSSDASDRS